MNIDKLNSDDFFVPNNTYLDFHTHQIRRKNSTNIVEIVSLHLGKHTKHNWFTIGKHPWWSNEILSTDEEQELTKILMSKKCLAMGEMGLDKLKGVDINKQIEIFKSQLNLANKLQKPVIIHCVRSFDNLIKIKKQYPKIKNWCIHGFSRHKTLAEQLINQGFYISLMPVYKITEKYIELVRFLPLKKMFLETDSMPTIKIEDIYLQVAKIKNISVDELKKQLNSNAHFFLANKN